MFRAPGPSPPGGGVRGSSGFCSSAILELSAVGFQPSARNDKSAAGKTCNWLCLQDLMCLGSWIYCSTKMRRLTEGVNRIEARRRARESRFRDEVMIERSLTDGTLDATSLPSSALANLAESQT